MSQALTAGQWRAALDDAAARSKLFTPLYGGSGRPWAARVALWRTVLTAHARAFGERPLTIARAPGRISLNPHSDHQGAFVLYGCHQREMLLAASPRADDLVRLVCVEEAFSRSLAFTLDSEQARSSHAWQQGWTSYIEAPAVRAAVADLRDPPSRRDGRSGVLNYVKAALLRLRHAGVPVPGLDLALAGDIAPASGMSSSSAIVVATALAGLALGGQAYEPAALAEMLGEAEWYVGTRGGSGDHAAMLLGERDRLTNIAFDPPVAVRAARSVTWPSDYKLLLANSGIRAEKSSAEKIAFNRGVFAYRYAGRAILTALATHAAAWGLAPRQLPTKPHLAAFTRDLLPLSRLYELLAAVPLQVTLTDLSQRYGEDVTAAALRYFDTDDPAQLPESLPLRGTAIYGLGRADRGLVQDALLAAGDPASMAEFGLLMTVTHDGDRVTRLRAGRREPIGQHDVGLDTPSLARLRQTAERYPTEPEVQLRRQPGFYGASIAELDALVDTALAQPGVLGAGLMGAGGGGVVQVLIDRSADEEVLCDALTSALTSVSVEPWQSSAPAGVIPLP